MIVCIALGIVLLMLLHANLNDRVPSVLHNFDRHNVQTTLQQVLTALRMSTVKRAANACTTKKLLLHLSH
jgi:hypothetical protein